MRKKIATSSNKWVPVCAEEIVSEMILLMKPGYSKRADTQAPSAAVLRKQTRRGNFTSLYKEAGNSRIPKGREA